MAQLELYFLGAPLIVRDGELVEMDTRKATALLAYLAISAETHTREKLAALLWPDYDESRARAALRRTLSVLRKGIGDDPLTITRDSVTLHADHISCDARDFETLLVGAPDAPPPSLAALSRAADLYRDDFLAGFTLRDAPPFDEWHYFQSTTYRRLMVNALEQLVAHHSAGGQYPAAVQIGQRWLAFDPLREEAHRALMRLYAWSGDRNAALRQYRACVRILEDELGVEPLEETTELYSQIREDRLPAPVMPTVSVSAPEPVAPAPGMLPFIGRTHEWHTLLQSAESGRAGGRLVAVEGEAGIGKTRLVDEFAAWAARQGATVLAARCYAGEATLAFGPLSDGLRRWLADPDRRARLHALPPHWLAEVGRLLPEVVADRTDLPQPDALPELAARSRFFEAITQTLLALATAGGPGLLVVDDIHWADDASLDLLTYLVRRLDDRPLLVVVTWRAEDTDAVHHLRRLLAEAQRAGRAALITLPRLTPGDVAELVAQTGSLLPADRLYDESEGVPYFIAEYLSALPPAPDDGAEWMLPPSVRDLLLTRLAAVSDAGRQLLQTAAVIGRAFDYELLHVASGRSEDEVVAGLEGLVARTVVRERADGNRPIYDFSHNKLRDLVYDETSLARRRLLHRRVAEALAAHAQRTRQIAPLAGQIATHYQSAGHDADAADYFRQAGDHARSLFANREALHHYQTALALGHPDPAALHEAIGDLHTLGGAYADALAGYERAAALADDGATARLEYRLGQVYLRQGEWTLAEAAFAAAQAALDDTATGLQVGLLTDWSNAAYRAGDAARATRLAQQALTHARQDAARPAALARAHNALGMLARHADDWAEAERHLQAGLDAAVASGRRDLRVATLNNLALLQRDRGALDAALANLRAALDLCVSYGDRHHEAALRSNLADLLHQLGQQAASQAELRQAVAIYAVIGGRPGAWQPEVWKLTEW